MMRSAQFLIGFTVSFLPVLVEAQAVVLPQPFTYRTQALVDCKGGQLAVADFDFANLEYASRYSLVVFHDGYKDLKQVLSALDQKGLKPVALVNGGFFELNESRVDSYFKSSFIGNQAPQNSRRGPRACMVFDSSKSTFQVLQSTDENYDDFKSAKNVEVYCAGPEMVENGKNVALDHYCKESFDPKCRSDHSDPGLEFIPTYPRSASCFTAGGKFKLFVALSDAQKCGMPGPELADVMVREGCAFGINHDGGGSAKLYLNDGAQPPFILYGQGDDARRPIPVWIAIVRK